MLTWTCALRHTGVQSFDIGTSKEAGVFCIFDLDECFPPVEPLSFEHLTWKCASRHSGMPFLTSERPKGARQKWSETASSFGILAWKNAFGAIVVCQFSTSKLPKVVHTSCVFDRFGSEMRFAPQRRALFHFSSRHMAPRPRFSEPTSRPSRPTSRKNAMFCDLPHISRACIFFLLTLSLSVFYSILLLFYSSLLSSTLIFSACHLPILSEVWLVNFRWLAFFFMRLLLFACARHFHILQQLDLLRDSLFVWKSQQLVRSVLSNDVNKSKVFAVSIIPGPHWRFWTL